MNKLFSIIFLLFFAACNSVNTTKVNTTLLDKVLESKTIRAAYTIYYPGCFKDMEGNLKGVFVETLEKAAKDLGLKVEWVEEVGWDTQIEGLNTGKYDMIGSSVWANPKRAKAATLSIPLYYSPLYIYTRSNETKFDKIKSYEELNNENNIFSLVDGGTGEVIYKNMFEKSRKISLPAKTDFGVSFLDVKSRKADLVIMEPFQAKKFIKANPNTIKEINLGNPLKVFGNCYMFKTGEYGFEHMLNVELSDLVNSTFVENLLVKYEGEPNNFARVAKSYQIK